MADPGVEEKELKAPDALAAAMQPLNDNTHNQQLEDDAALLSEKPGDSIGVSAPLTKDDEDGNGSEEADKETSRPGLTATKSHATDISVVTLPALAKEKKPWYKNPNPFRWGSIPPVPKERTVSREYKAGFFSKLTFEWMTPLMSVSSS